MLMIEANANTIAAVNAAAEVQAEAATQPATPVLADRLQDAARDLRNLDPDGAITTAVLRLLAAQTELRNRGDRGTAELDRILTRTTDA